TTLGTTPTTILGTTTTTASSTTTSSTPSTTILATTTTTSASSTTTTLRATPISGTQLLITDHPKVAKRKIVFVSKDLKIDTTAGAGIDPAADGAFFQVFNNAGGGAGGGFALPRRGWASTCRRGDGPTRSSDRRRPSSTQTRSPHSGRARWRWSRTLSSSRSCAWRRCNQSPIRWA